MLTPIYVNFIFKNAHLLASLGDKGSFRCANILQRHPLGWLRGVLAMFVANSLRISYILKLGKCPVILKSQPKELDLVHRSSRLKVQQSGNFTALLMLFFTYCKFLPYLVNNSWLWWIMREVLANQKRRNNAWGFSQSEMENIFNE